MFLCHERMFLFSYISLIIALKFTNFAQLGKVIKKVVSMTVLQC